MSYHPLVRLSTAQRKVADLSDCPTGRELEGIWDGMVFVMA